MIRYPDQSESGIPENYLENRELNMNHHDIFGIDKIDMYQY